MAAITLNNLFIEPLESTQTPAPAIERFSQAVPNSKKIIEDIESAVSDANTQVFWHDATVGEGNVSFKIKEIRSNKTFGLSDSAFAANNYPLQRIHNQFYLLLLRATTFYRQKYEINEMLFHEPYSVLKYQTGEEYKAHYDGTTFSGRFLSAIIYLNEEYTGGELEFPNFGLKIKPRTGDLFLFPSNYAYAHIAHPVTSGTKYAIVTWIHDRPIEQ